MREILDLCIRMEELAHESYLALATRCTDSDVGDLLERMADEESRHIAWWKDLRDARDAGLLPDVWADTDTLRAELSGALDAMRATVPVTGSRISGSDALIAAAMIDFFLLDPAIGELLDLAEPATAKWRHDSYARQLDTLVDAVRRHVTDANLAEFVSRVLRRSWREHRQLAHYATRDPLTGLGNRRSFSASVDKWTAQACRYGHPLAVVLVDLDRFKEVNDRHGRAAGDAVLQALGVALGSVTRASDSIARYGGDEFAILAPETGIEDARALTERVVSSVRAIEVPVDGGTSVHPTVSVGAAVLIAVAGSEPCRADALLAAADQCLYTAKQAGRDRTCDPVVIPAPPV